MKKEWENCARYSMDDQAFSLIPIHFNCNYLLSRINLIAFEMCGYMWRKRKFIENWIHVSNYILTGLCVMSSYLISLPPTKLIFYSNPHRQFFSDEMRKKPRHLICIWISDQKKHGVYRKCLRANIHVWFTGHAWYWPQPKWKMSKKRCCESSFSYWS